jgi:hypothetical protein
MAGLTSGQIEYKMQQRLVAERTRLRDAFASEAMSGMLAASPEEMFTNQFDRLTDQQIGKIADEAYRIADAMLYARERT